MPLQSEELALTYPQEYRLLVDRVKLLIDPSQKTLAVALALLSQHVTFTTIMKAVIQAECWPGQRAPRPRRSARHSPVHPQRSW